MIPYMVGKLVPNSSHLTRRLVKYVPGRDYFRAVSSQNGETFVTSPPSPPIVERFGYLRTNANACAHRRRAFSCSNIISNTTATAYTNVDLLGSDSPVH